MLSLPCHIASLMMLIFCSHVSIATPNCNHAAIDGYIVVADVCLKDGADSHMLQCRDGQGFYKLFTSNDNCDENHVNVFEWSLNSVFENPEVVCDAEPCHIAVFENYDGGLRECTGHCGAGGDEECDQEPELVWYCEDCNCKDLGDRADSSDSGDSSEWGNSNSSAVRRLQESSELSSNDSSSSESSSCDYDGTPAIYTYIIDTCVAAGEAESFIFTCSGTHDAMVGYFTNDEDHECSGTATITMSVDAFIAGSDDCSSMVACNVEAGADDEDAALTFTVFAPLLIAFTVLINA